MKKFLSKINRRDALTLLVLVGIFAFFFIMLQTGAASHQFKNMIIPMTYYILLAISLNLMVGVLGELSLGHAGFMSVGAYTGCFLSVMLVEHFPDLPMFVYLPVAMLCGGLMAALFGVIIGIPALRVKGDYLAIVTLAFCEIIKTVIINLDFLGGAIGFDTDKIVPDRNKALTLLPYAAFAVIVSAILIMNLVRSKHGRAIMAVRDNRIAAEACGINVNFYKVAVFGIAAFFAGVAGVLYGHNDVLLKSSTFDFNMSIEILIMVVLGGMGSNMLGSVIAAVVMTALPEILRDFSDYRMLIYSVMLIVIMLFTSAPALAGIRERLSLNFIKDAVTKRIAAAKAKKANKTKEEQK
ncbi:MAG: branched-chain amino acid ABC transporter permease [Clostridia bacterium]|nr:branched-chain amino acid ABC transporter permease [Clostridia bacterium]